MTVEVPAREWEYQRRGSSWRAAVAKDELFEAIEVGALDSSDLVKGPQDRAFVPIENHPIASEYVTPPPLIPNRESEEADPDLTPMIDVIFQLIIFFMIAATFTVQRTMDMPKTEERDEAAAVSIQELKDEHVFVTITGEGTIHVQQRQVKLSNLVEALANAAKERNSPQLVLDADDQALHEVVVAVLDAASSAEFETVAFVSRVPAN